MLFASSCCSLHIVFFTFLVHKFVPRDIPVIDVCVWPNKSYGCMITNHGADESTFFTYIHHELPCTLFFYNVPTPNNYQACHFISMPRSNEPNRAVRRSTRPTAHVATLSEEAFDLNVSGSEEDGAGPATPATQPSPAQPDPAQPDPAQPNPSQQDPAQPAPADAQPATPASLGINNIDVQEGRVYASDIRYFFEVTPNEKICKICR